MTVSMIVTSPRCDGLDQIRGRRVAAPTAKRFSRLRRDHHALVLSSAMRDASNEENCVKYEHDVCENLVQNITLRGLQ